MSETQKVKDPTPPVKESQGSQVVREIMSGNAVISVLAVVVALVIGGILIAVTDPRVSTASGYFFADPGATFSAIWSSVSEAYGALWRGATYDPTARTWQGQLGIFETLTFATPLILSGLAVTLAFRAGLFNIGAQGQIILGAAFAGAVGFGMHLPPVIHLLAVILAGAIGGAIWGGIAGFLKAKTGAHEVIVTIMLNYIAISLVLYLLKNQLKDPTSTNPISPQMDANAMFPLLLGPNFRVHAGLIVAILAVIGVGWLLNRSTLGFEYRAIGANPKAARTAGMLVSRGYITVMLISGALAGLAGVAQIAGTEKSLDSEIAGSIGFDAITVALLGRSKPWGTFFAALLFGAFKAGGTSMAVNADVSIDIVAVVQSLIVLFIAAPPLIRSIFRIKAARREGASA
ncbi:simple sugar transport system permease protein [Arthrobacter silviterrae]|uniref:ABC transporter permease n=1 Tax=Arthrobacter silviterrae TaxID=2026658 RepID=A0ABX0D8P6_9MICC|nr:MULTISPECIES: ABC transporter permease [Arthrobacter]MCU6481741.1 ABC transporter permease [Arthrobacter sp. A2-55]MDQ0279156.1 simple sugar transport system permease protein [Arthrobacter silviterrae]NGN83277.1 ABC transporter permease [Arthrobacter silviterrae]